MIRKIKSVFFLLCSIVVLLLAVFFYLHSEKIEAQAPLLTAQMAAEYQALQKEAEEKRQNAQAARARADMQVRVRACESDEECIIVDQDPCGCLKGPEGVTAINASYALEFSRLVEKSFAQTTTCPDVSSTERECSASARAVCQEKACHIVY